MIPVFPILLGGLLLVGVPILVHLIMRQKPRTLRFPAFRFLVERQRTNLRKLRLRHLLLLTLRMLLIAAIVLAAARLELFSRTLGLGSRRPVAAVLIFDTSPSMDYRASDGSSRLDEAKKRARKLLDDLPEGSRFLVLDGGDPPLTDRPDWATTRGQAADRIERLEIRPQARSPIPTLLKAFAILQDLEREVENKASMLPRFLFLFSDRTRGSWDPGEGEAVAEAADRLTPAIEGLQQAGLELPNLLQVLQELPDELPPPQGMDYGLPSLVEGIEKLQGRLTALSRETWPPDQETLALVRSVLRACRGLHAKTSAVAAEKESATALADRLRQSLATVAGSLQGCRTLVFDVGIADPVDLGILGLELPRRADGAVRQVFGVEDRVLVRARVRAMGKPLANTLACRLDSLTLRQAVDLPAGEEREVPFEIDLAGRKMAPGFHSLEVQLETGDQFDPNNRRYLTFLIQPPRHVLVLADEASRAADLELALRALGYTPEVRSPGHFLKLDFARYQAVYLLGLQEPSAPLWNALQDYVARGGGLAVVPGGSEMKSDAYSQEAARNLLPATFLKVVQGKKVFGSRWNLAEDDVFRHPLLEPFRRWRNDRSIDFIRYPRGAFFYWEVGPAADAEVVVRYADEQDRPALLEKPPGKDRGGRVLLLTTPLDPRRPPWNDYLESLTSFYLVLVDRLTGHLAGRLEDLKLDFVAGGEVPRVRLPLGKRAPSYLVRGPELLEQVPAPDVGAWLTLPRIERPGNYTVETGGMGGTEGRIGALSMNYDPAELDLRRLEPNVLESVFGPDSLVLLDRQADLRQALSRHWSDPVDLVPYLLLLVLLALALENLLANRFYRTDDRNQEAG